MDLFAATLIGALIVASAAFRRRDNRMTDLTVATLFASYLFLLAMMTATTGFFHPRTIDLALYRADRAIGLDPFALMGLVAREHWLNVLLFVVYEALPILIAIAWVSERSTTMLRAVVIAPIAALFLYNLLPAVGPIYAITPDAPHAAVPWKQIANLPRNCFPSMHLGWALLVALNAKRPVWRSIAWAFAILTAVATVGLGEHYYMDLIATVPFCFAVQYVAEAPFRSRLIPLERIIRRLRFSAHRKRGGKIGPSAA